MAGLGVRHGHHRREAAERGRPASRSRSSRPPPGPARAGGCAGRRGRAPTTQPRGVEHRRRRRRRGRRRPPTIRPSLDHDVGRAASPAGVDARVPPVITTSVTPSASTSPASARREPSSRNSTAMRTATPLATCLVITAPGRSATSAAISTPRFIGPGCMTSACAGRRAGPLGREAEAGGVLAQRRHQRLAHALALHAQQVDDVERRAARRRGRGSTSHRPPVERRAAAAWAAPPA